MLKIITRSPKETRKLGAKTAEKLSQRKNKIVGLYGDLGAGKTTFTQGFLEALRARGPFSSPTFLIMKEYEIESQKLKTKDANLKIEKIYHIDAYRVGESDILDLGWEEIIADQKNVIIVEWAEKIEKMLSQNALRVRFRQVGENEREITFSDDLFNNE